MTVFSKLVGLCLVILTPVVQATLEVRFYESAPKDRFVITNMGSCDLANLVLEFDLSESAGGLIFDTTASGAGVEVFQPFETGDGEVALNSDATVNDGDKQLSVRISALPANEKVSFTIDVDDTMKQSELGQIRVSGAEIKNGRITLTQSDATSFSSTFDKNSYAVIADNLCG